MERLIFVEIVLASSNLNKVKEIENFFNKRYNIKIITAAEAGFSENIFETGNTYEANAKLKAYTVAQAIGLPVMADDSGLEVEILRGAPGIISARYAGLGADYIARNFKLLKDMRGIPLQYRMAIFVCVIVYCSPKNELIMAEGRLKGRIGLVPYGEYGFGYDPIFEIPALGITLAMLSIEEKNIISHRGIALRKLVMKLKNCDI